MIDNSGLILDTRSKSVGPFHDVCTRDVIGCTNCTLCSRQPVAQTNVTDLSSLYCPQCLLFWGSLAPTLFPNQDITTYSVNLKLLWLPHQCFKTALPVVNLPYLSFKWRFDIFFRVFSYPEGLPLYLSKRNLTIPVFEKEFQTHDRFSRAAPNKGKKLPRECSIYSRWFFCALCSFIFTISM